jgi:hypothetical protein
MLLGEIFVLGHDLLALHQVFKAIEGVVFLFADEVVFDCRVFYVVYFVKALV